MIGLVCDVFIVMRARWVCLYQAKFPFCTNPIIPLIRCTNTENPGMKERIGGFSFADLASLTSLRIHFVPTHPTKLKLWTPEKNPKAEALDSGKIP
jgi:hypothetical protein